MAEIQDGCRFQKMASIYLVPNTSVFMNRRREGTFLLFSVYRLQIVPKKQTKLCYEIEFDSSKTTPTTT